MIHTARKVYPPVKWHGGKFYLARRIVALMPPHRAYVEAFAGGLSVLLNKPRSPVEAAADLNPELVNLHRQIRDNAEELAAAVSVLSYSGATFEAYGRGDASIPLDRAVRFLVRNRMSRGGLGKYFAWSERLRGGLPGDINAWLNAVAGLPVVSERLAGVEVLNAPALDVIARHDSPDTLVYADPPYLHETRTATKAYAHEMNRGQHERLLDALTSCRSRVLLSGYHSPLYDVALSGWTLHEFDMPNHAGQGGSKQRRVECVWVNF